MIVITFYSLFDFTLTEIDSFSTNIYLMHLPVVDKKDDSH